MSQYNLTYIIPPYLLNTCLGSELHRSLAQEDEQLSLLNVISTDSPHYYKGSTEGKTTRFSEDHYLNEIIKEKTLYKLAIIGVLGDNPMECDNSHLFELYNAFKHRLVEDESSSKSNTSRQPLGDSASSKISVYRSRTVGEINFSDLPKFSNYPKQYKKYLEYPLKDLIALETVANHKYKFPSSLVNFDNFDYPLPISWVPLVSKRYLSHLETNLNLKLNNVNGYSSLELKGSKLPSEEKSKYYNFITDKHINSSAGIFYYELEVEQTSNEANAHKTIISMNDQSMSSESSLYICAGYTKRFFNLENPISSSAPELFDLDKIKDEIYYKETVEEIQTVENLLILKPGIFKGSFAVDFENSTFYNSVKGLEYQQRTSLVNGVRRLSSTLGRPLNDLDAGKIDIGVPFRTKISKDVNTRTYKTDTIGCGINFIDKSIFITLNGVLARVIRDEELYSSSSLEDNLFSEKDNDVYPFVGFQVDESSDGSVRMKTNFGFKEFKFNIGNYVKNFKIENQKYLYLSLLDKISNDPVEKSLKEDSKMLNQLIKGYLNHEGYLETFKSFNADLKNLSQEVNKVVDDDDTLILKKSHATNRQIIKNYLLSNEFELLLKFLSLNYHKIFSSPKNASVLYEIDVLRLTYLLRNYIERKLGRYEFDFEYKESEEELYQKAYSFRDQLQNTYKDLSRINELSAALLVKDEKGLRNLPNVNAAFQNYSKNISTLLSDINKIILQSLGFSKNSNLESIFEKVNNNIRTLSLNDDKFTLVNFEKDHVDL
ncbi:hypothetical protein DFJ63DRAFT_313647 [Scheffersomyces coipomensis]|uniref:uncharacterized protein n=1 Tax=Scheffersomyces coipomensis TaxID=1788519 RepID=UPI00315C87E6